MAARTELRMLCPACGRVDKIDPVPAKAVGFYDRVSAWGDKHGVYRHTISSTGPGTIKNEFWSMNDTPEGRKLIRELRRRCKAFLERTEDV